MNTAEENVMHGNYMENFQGSLHFQKFPGAVDKVTRANHIFYFYSLSTTLQLTVLSDKIFRFRYGNQNLFEDDFSYAVVDKFKPDIQELQFFEETDKFIISTKDLTCFIHKADMSNKIYNKDGLIVLEDEKGYHWHENKKYGGNEVTCTKKLQGGENFYGLGDKPTDLNLRGKRLQLWGSDTYGFQKETDPIYKNIPFFLGLHRKVGYGIFFDNTFKSFFDFGMERKDAFSFWAEGGEMNYYFIYGPKLIDVTASYTCLTGKPEMPPLWALGYQQSKWSYYPEKVVKDLAATFRKKQIPCDVIHLDIDYMDGFRCFTWNHEHFPNPKKMISELAERGFKTVVIIDPGIKIDPNYWVYQEGLKNDYFCKRTDGPLFKGSVWPGLCNFPDFTNPKVREWWAGLFEDLIATGVNGVWNDMNEPAVFEEGTFPIDVRHDYDGHPCSHRKGHNVYGMQMIRATKAGFKKFSKDKRPFTITRSAYSGAQRYAAVWTGDNIASWDHLKFANVQCQRLSASGFSFNGSDIGGFIESPDGELYTRWIQMAVFHPFFRTHSSGDHGEKEPWTFGKEYQTIIKKYIELRYQLLPYMYSAFWQYATYGIPMIKSLHMLDQGDYETFYRKEEFMLGDNILVCPLSKKQNGRLIYLPTGTWYYFFDDTTYTNTGEIWFDIPIDKMPIFIKAGSVIPFNPIMQYVGEKKVDVLTLHVYFGTEKTKSVLYVDHGEGYEYQHGAFRVSTFEAIGDSYSFNLEQFTEGPFTPEYKEYKIVVHGLAFFAAICIVDDKKINFNYDETAHLLSFNVSLDFRQIIIKHQ